MDCGGFFGRWVLLGKVSSPVLRHLRLPLTPPFWVRHGGPGQNGQEPFLQTPGLDGQNDRSVFGLSVQFRDCATTHPINAHFIGQKGGREAKVWTDTDSFPRPPSRRNGAWPAAVWPVARQPCSGLLCGCGGATLSRDTMRDWTGDR